MSEPLETRIAALDIGRKRIGVAVSDPFGHFAVGLNTVEIHPKRSWLEDLQHELSSYKLKSIVVGLPRTLKGVEGTQAEWVREMGDEIEAFFEVPVIYFDERLTSVLAQQTLIAQGIQPSRNKGLVDQAAAKRILQDYLDSHCRPTS
jgi:putative holliday junction resolvase